LKLKCDIHLSISNSAFKFNLRRYTLVGVAVGMACVWWIMRGKNSTIEITLFFICAYAAMIASEQEGGASGRGAVENKHSTDAVSPPPLPCVCMDIKPTHRFRKRRV